MVTPTLSSPHKNSAKRERIMKWRGRFLAPVISTPSSNKCAKKQCVNFLKVCFVAWWRTTEWEKAFRVLRDAAGKTYLQKIKGEYPVRYESKQVIARPETIYQAFPPFLSPPFSAAASSYYSSKGGFVCQTPLTSLSRIFLGDDR